MASSLMGSFAALHDRAFSPEVFWLALLTTLLLQILSNLANDYGDSMHGADNPNRIGPARAVQSGAIPANHMKMAVIVTVLICLVAGIFLILAATRFRISFTAILFLWLGIMAIAAAIKYTSGKNPYGYKGFGDLSVFLFFGLAGVSGTYFLHSGNLPAAILLPSVAIGCWSMAVLNLNNMRDREADTAAGKRTFAVYLGPVRARIYHYILVLAGWVSFVVYIGSNSFSLIDMLVFIPLPFFILHLIRVKRLSAGSALDPELKVVALGTLWVVLTFGAIVLWQA